MKQNYTLFRPEYDQYVVGLVKLKVRFFGGSEEYDDGYQVMRSNDDLVKNDNPYETIEAVLDGVGTALDTVERVLSPPVEGQPVNAGCSSVLIYAILGTGSAVVAVETLIKLLS